MKNEMIEKFIKIEFANPNIKAIDAFGDIDDAIRYGMFRSNISFYLKITDLFITSDGDVMIKLFIPEHLIGYCNVKDKLSFIESYLLEHDYDGTYESYFTEDTLLRFKQIPRKVMEYKNNKKLSMKEQSYTISKFTKLLQQVDYESIETINKMLNILNDHFEAIKGEKRYEK